MPQIITTWVVRMHRELEWDEDPLQPRATDTEHLLWAIDVGEVSVTVDLIE